MPVASGGTDVASGGNARLDALEGLRGVAALSVLTFHLSFFTFAPRAGWIGAPFLQLNVGVWIFFVLSGFLLYTPFVRARRRGRRVEVVPYLRRRFLRIYPAYWLALGIVPFLLAPPWRFKDWSTALRSIFLIDTYTHVRTLATAGLWQSWTPVVEVTFYLFLPLYAFAVARLLRRREPRAEWVAIVALGLIGIGATTWFALSGGPLWIHVLPAYLTPFAVGMGAAVARESFTRWPSPRPWLAIAGASWLVVVVASFVASPHGLWWELVRTVGFTAAAGGLVVPLIDPNAAGRVASLARSAPLVALGRISYGIYLWHFGWIVFITTHWFDPHGSFTFVTLAAVATPLTLLTATLSYHLVERPAMALSRRRRSPKLPATTPR
jgi:peptidoglycan/LPS O-acetylase OafA/YrhL